MKFYVITVLGGIVILILGIIFHLQGYGVIGPQSSFMYSNPDWVRYGLEISITGLVILGIGIAIRLIKKA